MQLCICLFQLEIDQWPFNMYIYLHIYIYSRCRGVVNILTWSTIILFDLFLVAFANIFPLSYNRIGALRLGHIVRSWREANVMNRWMPLHLQSGTLAGAYATTSTTEIEIQLHRSNNKNNRTIWRQTMYTETHPSPLPPPPPNNKCLLAKTVNTCYLHIYNACRSEVV